MPEGDTIFRTAATLRRALQGAVVRDVALPRLRHLAPERLIGQTVERVEPRGKHLLIWFGPSGFALHTHLGMPGSWQLYETDARWSKPAHRAVASIDVQGWTAVCFDAPTCELLSGAQVERHPRLAALGPDALDPDVDLDEAARRLAARPEAAIADALLDQRVLAGIGNVYKSEVLFVHRLHPATRVGDVPPDRRRQLLQSASEMLKANVAARGPRTTTADLRRPGGRRPPASRLFVYGRAGRPCLRCGTPIAAQRHGEHARTSYWCPRCQPAC